MFSNSLKNKRMVKLYIISLIFALQCLPQSSSSSLAELIVNPLHSFGIIKIRTPFIQSKAGQFAEVIGHYKFGFRFLELLLMRNHAVRFNRRPISPILHTVINLVTAHRKVESFRFGV